MLLTRKFKSLLIAVFATALTIVSCSDDNEVIDLQEPQSQISDELRSKLIANSTSSQSNQDFQNKINWPQTINSTGPVCGVEIALLAYELYDSNNNFLNEVNVVPWIAGQGFTFQDLVDDVEQNGTLQYGVPVQAIFVAGVLVKSINQNSYQVAEISNYAVFSDFFNNCQSPDVTFQVGQGTFDFNIPMPTGAPVNFPTTSAPCASFDFPLNILVADIANPTLTFQESVDLVQFINYLQGNVTGFTFIDFVYPINLTLIDGTPVSANNLSELDQILNRPCI
jgi:hypothetical protein